MDARARTSIWYRRPAATWEEALPVGNGQLGAMVFGGVDHERIQLNEKSLWSGGPQDADNPEALGALPQIRKLLFEGRYAEAEELTCRTQVCKGRGSNEGAAPRSDYGCYQTLGDLLLDHGPFAGVGGSYRRELDLDEGIAHVAFESDGAHFRREIFASAPDRVLVVHLTCTRPAGVTFLARLVRTECARMTEGDERGIRLVGRLFRGGEPLGMRFEARARVIAFGGRVSVEPQGLSVEGAESVTLLLAAATDHRDSSFERQNERLLDAAARFSFADLRNRHVADHRRLFGRVCFDLGTTPSAELPTDERLVALARGEPDPGLYATFFQLGRYLLIASSRPGSLAANLQGIWADGTQTPWNCDYHTNINLQMNYWIAETANLAECAEPLVDLVEEMRPPGRRTATIHYGARGWVVHTLHNVWGYTSPGEHPSWGLSPTAGVWLCQHLWEHYAFGKDVQYLRRVYSTMRESAEFCLDWLVEDPRTALLVSGPATSPENSFIAPDGRKCAISMAPTMDQEIIWDHFTNVLDASEALEIDDDLVQAVRAARDRLASPKVGADGRLMEWAEEFSETEPEHRHVSHLFAVHPGKQIPPQGTPRLAEAAKRSLAGRGDRGTGWSMAWKICFWARLGDGDHAMTLLNNLLFPCAARASGAGLYPNLFCAHPPFQIDGNFGGAAGIAEMLVQSHTDVIALLPALPRAWSRGSISGLRARGGFEVDVAWSDGRLDQAEVRASKDGDCALRYAETTIRRSLKGGETWRVAGSPFGGAQ